MKMMVLHRKIFNLIYKLHTTSFKNKVWIKLFDNNIVNHMNTSLTKRCSIRFILCLLFLGSSYFVSGQQIYKYTNATSGAPFSVAANATGSNLTRVNGASIPASPCITGFSSNQWSTAGIINLNGPAVEITVTPSIGYYLNMTQFSVGLRRNGSGPPIARLAYSTDGGSTWVQQGIYHAPFNSTCGNTLTATWDFPDFSASAAIKFRIYAFSTVSLLNGQLQILNLNLDGAVSVTPLGAAAAITTQPSSTTVCEGQTASFSIVASGSPTPTIQWQKSCNGGSSWSTLIGETLSTLSFTTTLADNNCLFRAYAVNGSGSDTSAAAILTVNPLPTANAGANGTICSSGSYSLNGTVGGGASSGTWSTSGDGIFGNVNNLSTTYTPGTNDIGLGSVTVTLTTNDPIGPCGAANSQMTISIEPAATVSAGADQTICENEFSNLVGTVGGGAIAGTWSTSGDGVFANATLLSTTYTPGPNDISNGTVQLTLTSDDPTGVCGPESDFLIVSINTLPLVSAGANQSICNGSNVSLSGTVGGSAVTGSWSTSGDGNFNSINNLNATYYPGANDILNGTVTLTLTSADPAGPCGTVGSQMTVTITSVPAAPGAITGPTDVCAGTNGVSYSIASVSGATGYIWSSASWVTINGSSENVTMDFSPTITNSGTFIWVKATNGCGASADSSRRYIRHAIDVPQFVSPLTVVCANTNGVQFKIKPIEGYSSISWSSPAGTTIVNSNDSIVTIDFGAGFTSGDVTATATHLCMVTSRTASVSQGITRVPGNITGPNYGACDTTYIYSISPVAGASGYLWTAPAGATIIGAANGLSVIVQFSYGYTIGVLSVVAYNSCGLAGGSRNYTVRGVPQGPTTIFGPSTICAGQSGVVFSVNPTPATWSYLWTIPAGASIVSGQGSTSITVNFGAGGGNVNVRSVRPCGQSGAKSKSVTVNCRLAEIEEIMQVFPNPTSDILYLKGLEDRSDVASFEVIDVSGRVILTGQWELNEACMMSTSSLQNGIYILRIKTDDGIRKTQFVKTY